MNSGFHGSHLVEVSLQGLSPIQTIMKMAEPRNIIQMGLKPDEVISFGGGWCNHKSPELLQSIYKKIASDPELFHNSGRYSAIKGDYECCEQLCFFEKTIFNLSDLTPDNILLGHSSTQLFHDILRVIHNQGEDLCVLDPTYANYKNALTCAVPNGKLRFIPALDAESWQYIPDPQKSLDVLQGFCEKGAKSIIIPLPDNPTSQIVSNDFLKAIRDIMTDYQGFLILDFAYKSLWFDDRPDCFSWSPNDFENVICIHSNSKWLSSLGRRFGWIEAHPAIISYLEKITESTILSPDTLHSMATTMFLKESIDKNILNPYIESIRKLYRKTAEVMIHAIDEHLGWKYLKPEGGLYTVCPTPNHEKPLDFVEYILKKTGVLFIPGIGFGPSMNHGIRLSFGPLCYNHNLIDMGLKRVGDIINSNK